MNSGIGVGGLSVIVPMYNSECAPPYATAQLSQLYDALTPTQRSPWRTRSPPTTRHHIRHHDKFLDKLRNKLHWRHID